MSQPHIFVSYSHQDSAFARRLVDDLQEAGTQVWYDVASIDHGDFMQLIDEALRQCEWLVLVLSPAAIDSQYVKMEVNAALHRVQQGYMRAVIPMLSAPCTPNSIPALWDVLQRYDATHDYSTALAGLCRAVGLTAAAAPSPAPAAAPAQPAAPVAPTLPPDRFPTRLAQLGFVGRVINGVEVIIPPVCEVPAGEFLMGSDPKQDKKARDNEKPQHWVTLLAFQIARFPVTVAEYTCFVRAEPSSAEFWTPTLQLKSLDHPVKLHGSSEAQNYAAWLAKATGQPWRLPSEAEWEKAARWDPAQRHSRIYPWGDDMDSSRCFKGGRNLPPIGTYPTGASPCGAQDLAGYIWEYTSSDYMPYPYNAGDGRESPGSGLGRVLRGGPWLCSFFGVPVLAHTACRGLNMSSGKYFPNTCETFPCEGFRLARALPGS